MFQEGIAVDLNHLKVEGDLIAKNSIFIDLIKNADDEKLSEFLQKERIIRNIGVLNASNERGVIISRTQPGSKIGNNAFLTTPHGRAVSDGRPVGSIEISGVNPSELLMTTGRLVKDNGDIVGALFANNLMDDTFATNFRQTYLKENSEIVFYTKEFGIYGNSFSEPELRKIIGSYFNSGSSWIKDGETEKTVFFKEGKSYLVKNIVFPGLEQSPGGALVFIPRVDISYRANFIIALLTTLVFLYLMFVHHRSRKWEESGWRYFVVVIVIAIFVFGLSFFLIFTQNQGFVTLKRIPYDLYNSTLRIQPEWGIYSHGLEQHFTVIVDTGDEVINAVEAVLNFDPKSVEIKDLDTTASACSYIIEKIIDNENGNLSLSCVILDWKEGVRSLPIMDIVAEPLQKGTFDLSFNSTSTKVLAHDGLGTNVLRAAQGGSYRVDDFNLSAILGANETEDNPSRSFVVFSPSHPNQLRWYNHTKARFVWIGEKDSVYAYEFDNYPYTTPSLERTVRGQSISVAIPGDGTFYFHLQLASGGPIAHYKIHSDTTPPNIVQLNSSQEKIFEGDVVRFTFNAYDSGSGVDRNYYVDLGNRLFLPVGSELYVPFLNAGNQEIVLRVYDGAGNYSNKSRIIRVMAK